jgi:hypothetical protein
MSQNYIAIFTNFSKLSKMEKISTFPSKPLRVGYKKRGVTEKPHE